MLSRVTARNAQGATLELPLWEEETPYTVHTIDGLDPVKATYSSSSLPNKAGEQKNASKREKRNIIVDLGIGEGFFSTPVRELRDQLYNFFMPEEQVTLIFTFSDGGVYYIHGDVETMEAPLFAQEPNANISILCWDPDFLAYDPTTFAGATVEGLTDTLVNYRGTVTTGLSIVVNFDRAIGEFSVTHNSPYNVQSVMDFNYDFLAGDRLTISTVPGSKAILLTREGLDIPLLYAMSTASKWISFSKGSNRFRINAEGAPIPYTVTYVERLGGF